MLSPAPDEWTIREAAHLLNRAGFGGNPEQIAKLHAMGREKAVNWLLKPSEPMQKFAPPEWATAERDPRSSEIREKLMALRRKGGDLSAEERDRQRRQLNQQSQRLRREYGGELQGWWFNRMLRTTAPLREKMTLFWHDHYPSSLQKVRNPRFMYRQNQLFRRYATGSFKELTHKIVVDPAMMLYLDTAQSRKQKPNENFAREVLELFTLGEGHYTEQDIKAAARAFTGYFLNQRTGRVDHAERFWDSGEKKFLGKTGKFDGSDIVDIIFEQPQAARYLPGKLWEFFVYEDPESETIDALAKIFAEAKFDVAPLLRTIFLSKEFYSERTIRTRIKSPVEFLVQLNRQLEIKDPPARYANVVLTQLGQQLMMPPNVAGWDWGQAWINTNSLLTRYNVAGAVCRASGGRMRPSGRAGAMQRRRGNQRGIPQFGKGPDYKRIAPAELREDPAKLVKSLIERLFQDELEAKQRETFEAYAKAKKGYGFNDQEVAELIHLMTSTPYYQLT